MNEPIQEKTPKPPGLLPKHVQSWLLVGLAVLMVLIMWLTGGKKPQPATKATTQAATPDAPLEVNQTRINELQSRIEELQRQQLVAQNALTQQTRLLGAAVQGSQTGEQQLSASGSQPPERSEDAIQSERKKRQYLSLFASNVALSYRKVPSNPSSASDKDSTANQANAASQDQGTETPQIAQLLKLMQPPVALSAAPQTAPASPVPAPTPSPETNRDGKEDTLHLAAAPSGIFDAATGKNYLIFEGTILETVLINRLDGQFAGPVECLLTTNVYSHDRQHLLIPSGTRLLGETRKVDNSGQTRLAVVFHRLIMPDGYSMNLDQFKGLDQIGDTGLRDKVNNHYLRLFGVSLAIGALGAVAEASTGSALTDSGTDLIRQGFAASTAQSASQILDRFLNVLPTVTIREGHRVKVYLSGDLSLPDYNNHTMPSNF
jgi:type IV secretion system protein VirB10